MDYWDKPLDLKCRNFASTPMAVISTAWGEPWEQVGPTLEKAKNLAEKRHSSVKFKSDTILFKALQGRVIPYAMRIKSYQVKQLSQETFKSMDPGVLDTSSFSTQGTRLDWRIIHAGATTIWTLIEFD